MHSIKDYGAARTCHGELAFAVKGVPEIFPVSILSALEKHGREMREAILQRGLKWPRIGTSEMEDLEACLATRRLASIPKAVIARAESSSLTK